jgi:hypothetical protein
MLGEDAMLLDVIERIQNELRSGRFTNEAAVSQGIVLPVLSELGWPVFDTHSVAPEYVLEGRRVDFALCDGSDRPKVFLEVYLLTCSALGGWGRGAARGGLTAAGRPTIMSACRMTNCAT